MSNVIDGTSYFMKDFLERVAADLMPIARARGITTEEGLSALIDEFLARSKFRARDASNEDEERSECDVRAYCEDVAEMPGDYSANLARMNID